MLRNCDKIKYYEENYFSLQGFAYTFTISHSIKIPLNINTVRINITNVNNPNNYIQDNTSSYEVSAINIDINSTCYCGKTPDKNVLLFGLSACYKNITMKRFVDSLNIINYSILNVLPADSANHFGVFIAETWMIYEGNDDKYRYYRIEGGSINDNYLNITGISSNHVKNFLIISCIIYSPPIKY